MENSSRNYRAFPHIPSPLHTQFLLSLLSGIGAVYMLPSSYWYIIDWSAQLTLEFHLCYTFCGLFQMHNVRDPHPVSWGMLSLPSECPVLHPFIPLPSPPSCQLLIFLVLSFPERYKLGILLYVAFWDQRLSPTRLALKFPLCHSVASSFLSFYCRVIFCYMMWYSWLSIHLWKDILVAPSLWQREVFVWT